MAEDRSMIISRESFESYSSPDTTTTVGELKKFIQDIPDDTVLMFDEDSYDGRDSRLIYSPDKKTVMIAQDDPPEMPAPYDIFDVVSYDHKTYTVNGFKNVDLGFEAHIVTPRLYDTEDYSGPYTVRCVDLDIEDNYPAWLFFIDGPMCNPVAMVLAGIDINLMELASFYAEERDDAVSERFDEPSEGVYETASNALIAVALRVIMTDTMLSRKRVGGMYLNTDTLKKGAVNPHEHYAYIHREFTMDEAKIYAHVLVNTDTKEVCAELVESSGQIKGLPQITLLREVASNSYSWSSAGVPVDAPGRTGPDDFITITQDLPHALEAMGECIMSLNRRYAMAEGEKYRHVHRYGDDGYDVEDDDDLDEIFDYYGYYPSFLCLDDDDDDEDDEDDDDD